MKPSAIIFDHMEWQSPQPGMRYKVFRDGSRQLRLVELAKDFVEAQWCEKAHVGFVLSGELEVDFSGHVVRFPEGSALAIPSGSPHKARAVTPAVRLFLVEDIANQGNAAPAEDCPPMTSVTELPFNSFLGIQQDSEPGQLLRLPHGPQYLNHLGTVHAGAQLALAEAASGEFLLRTLGPAAGVVPVVRRLESKFRKPANGALTSAASIAPDALEQLRADLAGKGRASISVAVELHDESGAHTLSATVEWFIARTPMAGSSSNSDASSSHAMKKPARTVLVGLAEALTKRPPPSGNLAVPIFSHGSLVVELYAPDGHDPQKPHARDEIYFVTRGKGLFFDGERRHPVEAGSFIFVPAGEVHRFEDFSSDFVVWVAFYGPEGGERAVQSTPQ